MVIKFQKFVGFLVLLIVGALMLILSWQKWPDLLVDFGREAYIPWQINNGSVLYRDIAFSFGPLSPYLNAFLFKVFGTHLMTLMVFNVFLIIGLTFLLYKIFIITTDWITALMVSIAFLSLFAFSQLVTPANYNFVCPYSYNLTHGIFLSFLLIYILLIYLDKRQKYLIFVIGLILGLIFLTKIEVFLSSVIALGFGIMLMININRLKMSKTIELLGWIVLGFIIPISLFLVYFSHYMPVNTVLSSISYVYPYALVSRVSSTVFYRHILGTDDLPGNLLKLTQITVFYLGILLDFVLIGYCTKRFCSRDRVIPGIAIVLGLIFLLKICFMPVEALVNVFRPLPIVAFVLGVCFYVSSVRTCQDVKEAKSSIVLFVLSVFSFLIILKMGLNVHIYHYGFALAMPATCLLIAVIIYYLPNLFGIDKRGRVFLSVIGIILVGIFLIRHIGISEFFYSHKTFAVKEGLDTIVAYDPVYSPRGPETQVIIDQINKTMKNNENFVVFPEGVMLNYLTRRPNPTPYINFMPPELITFGEDKIINSFIKSKPDYFILVDRDLSEYSCSASSENCGNNILKWINKNYSPFLRIGPPPLSGRGFGLTLCQRKVY